MPTDHFPVFLQLSALLTGFAPSALNNSLQSNQPGPLYWQYAQDRLDPTIVANLLDLCTSALNTLGKKLSDTTAEERRELLRHFKHGLLSYNHDDPRYMQSVQMIVAAWYLGSWYQLYDHGAFAANPTQGEVVSSHAYTKALSWQVMQSHAMGDSAFTFGYWHKAPAAELTDYTGYDSE